MLTLYFIMIQYTAKNSKDEIPIGFIRELVAMCSGAQTIFAFKARARTYKFFWGKA